jgi:hypothetical protein
MLTSNQLKVECSRTLRQFMRDRRGLIINVYVGIYNTTYIIRDLLYE